jgi:hypothetical protein
MHLLLNLNEVAKLKNFSFSKSFLETISCPAKGNFAYNQHLRPLTAKPDYFDYGDLLHFLLEEYYNRIKEGDSLAVARDFAVERGRKYYPNLELAIEECESCVMNFIEYVKFYQSDGWRPVNVEQPFAIEVFKDESFTWADGDVGLTLIAEGIIDLEVINENGNEMLVDHKSVSRNNDPPMLNYQNPLYCFVRGKKKVVINSIGKQKTLKPAERFNRYQKFYSEEWLTEFMQEVITKVILWLRNSEAEFFPRDFSQCKAYNKDCMFSEICKQVTVRQSDIIAMNFMVEEKQFSPFERIQARMKLLGE